MAISHSLHPEALVLDLVRNTPALTLDEVGARLPQLRWGELFQAVDTLSRRGAIILRRKGFEYEVRPAGSGPRQGAGGGGRVAHNKPGGNL